MFVMKTDSPNMSAIVTKIMFLLLILPTMLCNKNSVVDGMLCIESERVALLKLKHDFIDESNRLASWGADTDQGDCCKWSSVACDNVTGHVTHLLLQNPVNYDYSVTEAASMRSALRGTINPSLSELKRLVYLNLSGNYFPGETPSFISSIGSSLEYLDLSNAGFQGHIPPPIGNLTNLRFLSIVGRGTYYTNDLGWLSKLTSLEYLDLSDANLASAVDWFHVISANLPSLIELRLSSCQLPYVSPSLNINNSSALRNLDYLDLSGNDLPGSVPWALLNVTDSLRYLHLSFNQFNSSIPSWFYSSTFSSRLEYLHLGANNLQGNISTAIGNLTSLIHLYLGGNDDLGADEGVMSSIGRLCGLTALSLDNVKLKQDISDFFQIHSKCSPSNLQSLSLSGAHLFGHLSDHLGLFRNLELLDLSYNSISGSIPTPLGSLSSLRYIYIYDNLIDGVVSELQFNNLTKLYDFIGSGNSLKLEVSPNWIPPFQLSFLGLGSWQLGPQFPLWLRTQNKLVRLDLSNTGISETIPNWVWNSWPSSSLYFNISQNQIPGELPDVLQLGSGGRLDFSSNRFEGRLPFFPSDVYELDLSNNSLSGSISRFLCHEPDVSKKTHFLNLAGNLLSGEIPDCWEKWNNLKTIRLSNNNFTGTIPSSMANLILLRSLHMRNNKLFGEIPSSLKNCSGLKMLDLGENHFDGKIPKWIGEAFSNLVILILRSNKFDGEIPKGLCRLSSMQILDLAHNSLTGFIPQCVNNFSAMIINHSSLRGISYMLSYKQMFENALVVLKGNLFEYDTTLYLVSIFDLSLNKLSGEIPKELTSLVSLQSLNLSNNFFIGRIPEEFGDMRGLESLDLSVNRLNGEIPLSVSKLNFLSHFNVSNNNLTGMIPHGTQLQGLNASCFAGNQLCGPPLTNTCDIKNRTNGSGDGGEGGEEDSNGHETILFYTSMAYGFVIAFWCVVGPLMFIGRWRHAYFHFLDKWSNRIWMFCRYGYVVQ